MLPSRTRRMLLLSATAAPFTMMLSGCAGASPRHATVEAEFAALEKSSGGRLDRYETELNTAIPGDLRDTSTPAAMGQTLRALVLGGALPPYQRALLTRWLRESTTGAHRIRAGVPAGWSVGDKTGSGEHGTSNDAAILWPVAGAPLSLVVYYTQVAPDAKWKDEVVATAARIAVHALR